MASDFKPGRTVGIDLGTTRSTLAHLDEHGKAAVIPNAEAELVTPSVVLIEEDDIIVVGSEAKNQAVAAGDRVIRESKREIGRTDMSWPIDGTTYSPEMVGSMVLKKLKEDTESKLGEPVVNAVITVPAYFDDAQRAATEAAGQMAGLNVVGILNEPVAAALSYGLDKKREDGHVIVYDLGGGTFDVSVMNVASGKITMVATDGNVELGGKDWDERIIARVVEKFVEEHGSDPTEDEDAYQQLKNDAEAAKESLTAKSKTRIIVNYGGNKMVYELTRDEFEEMTEDLLSQTAMTLTEVAEDQAGLSWDQISRILLVGGSSKMPQVARMIQEETGKDVAVGDPEPDLCVALGAAYYGTICEVQQAEDPGSTMTAEERSKVKEKIALLPPAQQKSLAGTEVTMVTSHSYGVEVLDENGKPYNSVMIKKNSALPASCEEEFYTAQDQQCSVEINVLEGEESDLQFCQKAGTGDIQFTACRQGTPVKLVMEFTREGVIKIHAECQGKTFDGTFDRPQGLSQEELEAAAKMISKKKMEN